MNIYCIIRQRWGHFEVIASFTSLEKAVNFSNSMNEESDSVSIKQVAVDKPETMLLKGEVFYECYVDAMGNVKCEKAKDFILKTEFEHSKYDGTVVACKKLLKASSQRKAISITKKALQNKTNESNKR